MNEDKIRPARAPMDAECFWCEHEIEAGTECVQIEFKIKIPLLGSTAKFEHAHPECADQIALLLHGSAADARSTTKRRQR